MGRPAQLQNQKPLQPCACVLDESQFLIMGRVQVFEFVEAAARSMARTMRV
jgi:hypothetical protein